MLKLLNRKHYFFFVLILVQLIIYNYPYHIQREPRTVHAWRQFDCLSFAQSFYNERASLFEPAINNLGQKGTGKTASEFPIVPYLVAKIWKITGMNSSVYKLVNLLFTITGLFFVYLLFLRGTKNKIASALITALIFSSPILSYYGISTISDIQAFSLSLIGFYFMYKYVQELSNSSFWLCIILFSIAALIKASAALVFIVAIIYFRPYNKSKLKLISIFIPPIIWASWYMYVNYYNEINNGGFFLIGLLPIWKLNHEQLKNISTHFFNDNLPQVISPIILIMIFISGVFVIIKNKNNTPSRNTLTLCLLLFVAFIILFFGALNVHDYYFINPFSLLIIASFYIITYYWEIIEAKYYPKFILTVSILSLVFSYTSGIKTWKKINCNVNNFENKLVFNKHEQKNYFWIYWLDREMYKVLEDKNFNIESAGVQKSDTVFCLGDNTINRALYMINRVGYSSFNVKPENTPNFIQEHQNIKYIVLIDSHLPKKHPYLSTLLLNEVYKKQSLSVYKVN